MLTGAAFVSTYPHKFGERVSGDLLKEERKEKGEEV